MGDDGWCTIESDPGVFTELLAAFGAKDLQVEELYSLDDDSLAAIKPIYGLVFLFKWQEAPEDAASPVISEDPGVFFANQVVNNACATQALIQILLNKTDEIDVGPELGQFKEFSAEMTTDLRGLAISNSESIRAAHNSFSHQRFISIDDPNQKGGDAFHFISYIQVNGRLIELDGLKPGPIDHGVCTKDDWLGKSRTVIESRIAQYSQTEIRFNLMAVVKDRTTLWNERLAEVQSKLGGAAAGAPELQEEERACKEGLGVEAAKRAQWAVENVRRRHNFLPLCMAVLKLLADQKALLPAIKQVKAAKAGAAAGGGTKRPRT